MKRRRTMKPKEKVPTKLREIETAESSISPRWPMNMLLTPLIPNWQRIVITAGLAIFHTFTVSEQKIDFNSPKLLAGAESSAEAVSSREASIFPSWTINKHFSVSDFKPGYGSLDRTWSLFCKSSQIILVELIDSSSCRTADRIRIDNVSCYVVPGHALCKNSLI